jgi:hypothetical protein
MKIVLSVFRQFMKLDMIGKIQGITKQTCYVSLYDPTAGERYEAECNPNFIQAQGLKDDDEFRVEIINGFVSLKKLAPKKITERQVRAIRKKVDETLSSYAVDLNPYVAKR